MYSLEPQQWISSYRELLYKYSLHHVNDSGLAEDLVQETFLSAWKARNNFRGEATEKSWLFRICKNKIIDHYRRKNNGIIQLISEFEYDDPFSEGVDSWTNEAELINQESDLQQPLDQKEFYAILNGCLDKLNQMQQSVFSMKYLEDLKSDEICRKLDISLTNYWVLVHRAKQQLRSCLKKNCIHM